MILAYRLTFNDHLEKISEKVNGEIAKICNLQYILPRIYCYIQFIRSPLSRLNLCNI